MAYPTNLSDIIRSSRPNAMPLADYEVRESGDGPVIAFWDAVAMGAAQPSEAQVLALKATYDADAPKRVGLSKLQEFAMEFLIAFIVNQRFGDNTRLLAVNAKIDAWKAAHPGVIP
jgi:hypothetical protein